MKCICCCEVSVRVVHSILRDVLTRVQRLSVSSLGSLDLMVKFKYIMMYCWLFVYIKVSYCGLLPLWFHLWLSFDYPQLHVVTWLIFYLWGASLVGPYFNFLYIEVNPFDYFEHVYNISNYAYFHIIWILLIVIPNSITQLDRHWP